MAIFGIDTIHRSGLAQMPHKQLSSMRQSSRESESSSRSSVYVSVGKPAGAMTARQHETNGDVSRAAETIGSYSKQDFSKTMPPPPSGGEMDAHMARTRAVPDKIYSDNPVKPVPFGSQVMSAYNQQKAGSLQVPMAKLHSQYTRFRA
ncbi:MAG: hypothetical protein HQL54_11320 [Magnetococcales bacterium]|nr:hypothetical protein [Magnetococcales bacterium]